MKKMFLAVLTSLALCSYGFAQDEDEYEEDEAPAKVEKSSDSEYEDEDEAPAPKKSKKEKSAPREAVSTGEGFMAFGLDLVDAIDGLDAQKFFATFKIQPDMELSVIFALYSHGETTAEYNGQEVDQGDDYTQVQLGVGFDWFLVQKLLPISVGGEFLFSHWYEDNNQITFNVLGGFRANLVSNFYLTGKVGLGIDYFSETRLTNEANVDYSRLDFSFKTEAVLSWFFM